MTTDTRPDVLEHRIGRDGLLVLRVHDGDVRIRGVAGDTARVRADDPRSLAGLVVERGETSLSITAGEQPTGRIGVPGGGSGSVDLVVEIPEAATVVLDAASADIEAEHLVGESRLRTASGDLDIRDIQGTLNAEAVSGDIDIRAKGPLAATVRTVSGDLQLEAPILHALQAATTSGDITIVARFEGGGPFSVETVSGDTSIESSGPFRVEATTLTGDLPGDHGRSSRDSGPVVIGSDEGPTITFRSTSGDLGISPARSGANRDVGAPALSEAHDADDTSNDADDPSLEILRALERGEIDVIEAGRRLSATGATGEGSSDA